MGEYRVTAFSANHATTLGALVYAIESEGRCLFYGTDTAAFFEQTWQAFHQLKLRFDIVILDHTYGLTQSNRNDHLNAAQFIQHIERMRSEQLLTSTARIFATHISHAANPAHPELVAFASQHGYDVAYDGLCVEI